MTPVQGGTAAVNGQVTGDSSGAPRSSEAPAAGVSPGRPAWRRFASRPLGVVAVVWLLIVVAGAAFASSLAPYNPLTQNLSVFLQGPSLRHLLGTDPLGRDVLSQLLYGGRPTLLGVAIAVAVWLILGVALGVTAGYVGGLADTVITRTADLLMSLPVLVVLLVIFAVFPQSLAATMAALGAVCSGGLIRVIRSVTLVVRHELYIKAARVSGLSELRIIVRHVLPRITSTVIIQAALFASVAVVVETGLAFLGFGVTLPSPSWGGLVLEASQTLSESAWLLVPSAGIVAVTILALILFGNAVRDVTTERWSGSQGAFRVGSPGKRPALRAVRQLAPSAGRASEAALSVEGLSVELVSHSGLKPVVSEVSFTIRRGETLAVLGESGCGKTMMALAVLGLLPRAGRRTAGQVFLGAQDLTSLSSRELAGVRGRRIGYVAQDPMTSLDPTFTVGAQIAEAVRHHRQCGRAEARRVTIDLLESVRLPDAADVARRYPFQLSGGMIQRCVIALALAGDPDVLIADEPTTALDVTTQAEILALLESLQDRRHLALLIITHNWGVVATSADRAIVMYAGEVVEEASVSKLLDRPAHPYTRSLLASNPALAASGQRLPVIAGTVPAPGSWPRACRFAPRCPEAGAECMDKPILISSPQPGHAVRCVHVNGPRCLRREDQP